MVTINTHSVVLIYIPGMYLLSTLVHIQSHMFHLHDDRNQTHSDRLGNIRVPRCYYYKLYETNSMIQLLKYATTMAIQQMIYKFMMLSLNPKVRVQVEVYSNCFKYPSP